MIKNNVSDSYSPLVSVVMPVYNGQNYLHEAIESVLSQTYKNIEIIIVNDGSTDDTEKIVKTFGNKIQYFKKENGGVATALNFAIQKTKGSYISWLSHDDKYFPNKIYKQIKYLSSLPQNKREKTILYSNYSLKYVDSATKYTSKFELTHQKTKLDYPLYPILNGLIHGCTLMIPKKCFEKYGFFNPKLKATQDYELWFKMFPHYYIHFMKDILIESKQHSQQGSKTIKNVKAECDNLWIWMMSSLSLSEINNIADNSISFYRNTYSLMKGAGYIKAMNYCQEQIDKTTPFLLLILKKIYRLRSLFINSKFKKTL